MARQSSIFKLVGQLDGVSFYKSGSVFIVRRKGGVSPERMANDPAFRKQRAHVLDFTRAAPAAKLIRKSIEGHLNQELLITSTLHSAYCAHPGEIVFRHYSFVP